MNRDEAGRYIDRLTQGYLGANQPPMPVGEAVNRIFGDLPPEVLQLLEQEANGVREGLLDIVDRTRTLRAEGASSMKMIAANSTIALRSSQGNPMQLAMILAVAVDMIANLLDLAGNDDSTGKEA